ncbi:hypothetical protein GCM10010299_02930 [Streptomyces tanashiensis]|nr:hypothetical protein GCM10010299_02930 [Streptomyces tanashiensis]
MDRSRLIAVASGIIAVGLAAGPAAAADGSAESPAKSSHSVTSTSAGTLADDVLVTNDFPCCV